MYASKLDISKNYSNPDYNFNLEFNYFNSNLLTLIKRKPVAESFIFTNFCKLECECTSEY